MFDNLFVHWGMAATAFTIGGLLLGGATVFAFGVRRAAR